MDSSVEITVRQLPSANVPVWPVNVGSTVDSDGSTAMNADELKPGLVGLH